jgi:DNA transformation protein
MRLHMNEFIQYLHELFELLGPITTRRMFDGHTVYHQGLPIGIVYQETLYLKADKDTTGPYLALGLPQFTYEQRGKVIGLPYYQAPEGVLEDRGEAAIWGRRAFESALRMQARQTRRKKSPG